MNHTSILNRTSILFSSIFVALVCFVPVVGGPTIVANDAWFQDVAGETGLRFEHVNGATGEYYLPEIMGAGAALVDIDGDGDMDVLIPNSGANQLVWRENTGNGTFQAGDVVAFATPTNSVIAAIHS